MKDLKDMSAREIISTVLLVCLGVGLWDCGVMTIEHMRNNIEYKKVKREHKKMIAKIQDLVDNHGFTEGLSEEDLQTLREIGIKF